MAELGSYPQSTERIVMQADLEAMTYVQRSIKAATAALEQEVAWLTKERDEARAALAAERSRQRDNAIPAHMFDEGRAAGDLLRH